MKPRMILKASMPFLRDRKMEIKSVPPVVASHFRQRLIAKPLIRPPKISRQTVCQKTGEEYDKTGTKREFFADKAKTDINRNGIQKNVDSSIRYCYMKITVKNALD